jgi:hypothetical protein
MSIEYQTYDDLLKMVAEFRLEHRNLTDEDLDKLINQTFKIDRATLREMDGRVIYPSLSTPSFTGVKFRNALSIITSSSM